MGLDRKLILFFITASLFFLVRCKPDNDHPADNNSGLGNARIQLSHFFESNILNYDYTYYNAAGDTMKITRLRYYLSNITLVAGTQKFVVPNSYYLIDESEAASKTIQLTGLPTIPYDAIEFIIGVDSARNMSGAQTGVLDPQNNMFWSWSSGYIFTKLEGYYQNNGVEAGFSLHVGGYKYPSNCIRKATVSFGSAKLQPAILTNPVLKLKLNVNEYFKSPRLINLNQFDATAHDTSADWVKLADNYADMFSFGGIQ